MRGGLWGPLRWALGEEKGPADTCSPSSHLQPGSSPSFHRFKDCCGEGASPCERCVLLGSGHGTQPFHALCDPRTTHSGRGHG